VAGQPAASRLIHSEQAHGQPRRQTLFFFTTRRPPRTGRRRTSMNVFNQGSGNDARMQDLLGKLEKHMPLMFALLIAFLAGKALKKMFWTAFGMYMALHYSGIHLFG
jgi:hypothetical protein